MLPSSIITFFLYIFVNNYKLEKIKLSNLKGSFSPTNILVGGNFYKIY